MDNEHFVAWENKYAKNMMPKIERLYAEFWLWSKANGYEIAMGDMKKAWGKYCEEMLSDEYKNILFGGYFPERIKKEFNDYCASQMKSERAILMKQKVEAKAI